MSRGIRDNWEGLKIRIDKTKELATIIEFQHDSFVVYLEEESLNIRVKRSDFTVLRNQVI